MSKIFNAWPNEFFSYPPSQENVSLVIAVFTTKSNQQVTGNWFICNRGLKICMTMLMSMFGWSPNLDKFEFLLVYKLNEYIKNTRHTKWLSVQTLLKSGNE